jgi:hypothetical protein
VNNTICRGTVIFNGQVYICQLAPGHAGLHEDSDNYWEVVSDPDLVSTSGLIPHATDD